MSSMMPASLRSTEREGGKRGRRRIWCAKEGKEWGGKESCAARCGLSISVQPVLSTPRGSHSVSRSTQGRWPVRGASFLSCSSWSTHLRTDKSHAGDRADQHTPTPRHSPGRELYCLCFQPFNKHSRSSNTAAADRGDVITARTTWLSRTPFFFPRSEDCTNGRRGGGCILGKHHSTGHRAAATCDSRL